MFCPAWGWHTSFSNCSCHRHLGHWRCKDDLSVSLPYSLRQMRTGNISWFIGCELWRLRSVMGGVFSPAEEDGTYYYTWNPLVSTVRAARQPEGCASALTITRWMDRDISHHGTVLRKGEEDYQGENSYVKNKITMGSRWHPCWQNWKKCKSCFLCCEKWVLNSFCFILSDK